ncbi:uncharacterized protein LOC108630040 [Ceratina calcarata]|uniref:Uncharacterized protein LOC108630040 n=1 Tax=Ceratina calcarata TaxID=156304 RepID=A0AAJ7JBA9_9HYME|nr:uncharacterized protein LOC108630040 [Ceratina calcarata]
MTNNIDNRFSNIERNTITRNATILDPRFKTAIFQNQADKEIAVQNLKEEIQSILATPTPNTRQEVQELQEAQIDDQRINFWKHILDKVSHFTRSSSEPAESASSQIENYLKLPYENINSDPIT